MTGNARTYLILDDADGAILAYFSITFKELILDGAKLAKAEVRRMDGIRRDAERIRAYLIGQLGKNAGISSNRIRLADILEEIYSVIAQARALIGGRIIFLECEDDDRLLALYEDHGFKLIESEGKESPRLRIMYTHTTE